MPLEHLHFLRSSVSGCFVCVCVRALVAHSSVLSEKQFKQSASDGKTHFIVFASMRDRHKNQQHKSDKLMGALPASVANRIVASFLCYFLVRLAENTVTGRFWYGARSRTLYVDANRKSAMHSTLYSK